MFSCLRGKKSVISGIRYVFSNSTNRECFVRPFVVLSNYPLSIRLYTSFQNRNFQITDDQSKCISRRKHQNKKKSAGYNRNVDSDDEDDDDDELEIEDNELYTGKGSEIKIYNSKSLRMDAVLKSILGISRKKIEEIFYDNRIRINNTVLLKKSCNVEEGNEIDIIKENQDINDEKLNISRIQILKIKQDPESDRYLVKAYKIKSLVIKNLYEREI